MFLRSSLKFLFVAAAFALVAGADAQANDHAVSLDTGWTDIGIATDPGDFTLRDLHDTAEAQGVDVTYIARWDNNSWLLFDPLFGFNEDYPVSEGEGYFVYSNTGGTFTLPQPSQDFTIRVENAGQAYGNFASGVFNTPTGASGPGPLTPGESYEFSFYAGMGQSLHFATMFIPSNDFFYAPDGDGIPLYDMNGTATTGDITSFISLWDSGTEENQEPGAGDEQPQRGPGSTPDPDNTVRLAPDDFGNLPAVADVISVSIANPMPYYFVVTIENVSQPTTLSSSEGESAVPLSPGVYAVTGNANPLFEVGNEDYGQGLEEFAESGDPSILIGSLAADTGVTTVLSPGASVIHTAYNPMFTNGMPDRGEGLEGIAEDGMAATLVNNLAGQTGISSVAMFNTPVGAADPGPLPPGNAYEWTISASPGDHFSLATMWVQSNDLILAPAGQGIALFNADGSPISGDVSNLFILWDVGTEMNEVPGIGPNQAPRQAGPDTGVDEDRMVMPVNDGYMYPRPQDSIRVTITPVP